MSRGLSISLRLTFWFTAIFLCGFTAFGSVLLFTVYSTISSGRDQKLDQRADQLIAFVKRSRENKAGTSQTQYSDSIIPDSKDHALQLYMFDGKILTKGKLAALGFPWPTIPAGRSDLLRQITFGDEIYHVDIRESTLNGTPIRVFVARRLTDNPSLLNRPIWILIRFVPVMLLASALAGYFVSRRALLPVANLTDSVRSISIGSVASRLPVNPNRDELSRLAITCNEMLDRLEHAIKQIAQFTADASHELRSPIAFIRATSEYALSAPGLGPEAKEAFKNIISESDHSLTLLEDMLLLARFDAGRGSFAFEPVFLGEIVQEVVGRMRVFAQEKNQTLTERIGDADLSLYGDTAMIRRLVWILVDNAIKYTQCEGAIEVELNSTDTNAHLRISDSGPGIPTSLLPHVFDRFFRVDPSRSEQAGTGLGLAIAKQIVETHNATIAARHNYRAGATFEVIFPLPIDPQHCLPALNLRGD